MEDDYRKFQPVKLDITGIETGSERYLRDGWNSAPQIAVWRNNLTACSQHYNLYFVAHHDHVAVFQPSFPSHILGRQPQINITPTLANPNARGTLDPSRPHGINHLIVGELGSEEILFLSTDSGNVVAYYTAAIEDGIDKEPYKFSQEGRSDLIGVRPFFTHWVHESAWGLSIHKNARMLAVSSNKPRHQSALGFNAAITVFAFALTTSNDSIAQAGNTDLSYMEESGSDWKLWTLNPTYPTKKPDRSVNWKTRLQAHPCNIPSISFVNSEDDYEGDYLLSTDIEGTTKCWHVWQGVVSSSWDFSAPMCGSSTHDHNSQQTLGGWTVLALDPCSFQTVKTQEAFCGEAGATKSLAGYLDITDSLLRVPGNNRSVDPYVLLSSDGSDSGEESDEQPYQSNGELSGDNDQEAVESVLPPSADAWTATPELARLPWHSSSDEHSQVEGDEASEIEHRDEMTDVNIFGSEDQVVANERPYLEGSGFNMVGDYHWSDLYHSEFSAESAKKVKLHHPGTSNGPTIPTLHLSASHLRLFDASRPHEASVYCSDMLSLQWPIYHANRPGIDRLNLTQYVPELGIVVIGTQIGRVAVCSLTRKGSTGSFGLRVDWIVPLESQEKKRQRPLTPLLGIAVGPVQGHQWEDKSSSTSGTDEDAEEDTWLQDKVDEDGVSITFDPEVIKLGQICGQAILNIIGPKPASSRASRTNPTTIFKRSERKRSPPVIINQPWPTRSETIASVQSEPWRGLEFSRRYRLMLTYYDHTIMTYELSKTAPFIGDPVEGRQNWRNRDEF